LFKGFLMLHALKKRKEDIININNFNIMIDDIIKIL
jgi:hypothetical protein